MSYSVTCPCGKRCDVAATAAGSTIACDCGRPVPVPALSELRLSAGQEAYDRGTAGQIAGMVRRGALPVDELCCISGRSTQDVAVFCIACERVQVRHSGLDLTDRTILGWLVLGWLGIIAGWIGSMFAWKKKPKPIREHGREVVVYAPVRISEEYHPSLKRRSQRYLKDLLKNTPIYAALLKEYPKATVSIVKAMPGVAEYM